jgi:UMF1 family MFS transporter
VLGVIADASGRRKPWIAAFGIILAVAGTFGGYIGGKLDDALGSKRVIAGSMVVLLLAIVAILWVDEETVLFVHVTPPQPGGALFSSAAEHAYLILGCCNGAVGAPLQAASRSLLIRFGFLRDGARATRARRY